MRGSGSDRRAMRRFGSDQERRRRRAIALYEFEMLLREEGISDFVYEMRRKTSSDSLMVNLPSLESGPT
jgi:hypothetical protein